MKASSKKLRNRPAFFQNFRDNTIIFCSAVIYLQCYKKSQYFKIVNHVRKNLKKKNRIDFSIENTVSCIFSKFQGSICDFEKIKRKTIKIATKKSEQNPVDLSLKQIYFHGFFQMPLKQKFTAGKKSPNYYFSLFSPCYSNRKLRALAPILKGQFWQIYLTVRLLLFFCPKLII